MTAAEVDAYLAALPEPKRSTMAALRATLLELLPEGEEGISYQMPVVKVRGKAIAGYAAFARHLTYAPHSGSVLPELREELAARGYKVSGKAATFQFPVDQPPPRDLLEKLVDVRMRQAFGEGTGECG